MTAARDCSVDQLPPDQLGTVNERQSEGIRSEASEVENPK